MSLMNRFFAKSPFDALLEHTSKVDECVQLVLPIAEALLAEDVDKLEELHDKMSLTEHEADNIKNDIRDNLGKHFILSMGKDHLQRFLSNQDDVADACEDFAVVAVLRKTTIHDDLKDEFKELAEHIVQVPTKLMVVAGEIKLLMEAAFTGIEARKVIDSTNEIFKLEWEADKLQRHFSKHYYAMEDQLDPVTIIMYDKYMRTLGQIANKAEASAKILHQMVDRQN